MAIRIDKDLNWDKASDEEKISFCEELFTADKGARQRRDFEWYLNYMFEEGHHYAYYNTVTNALERPPRRRGEVRLVINKIKSSKRAVQNYATRFEPRWEVIPGDIDEETIVNARRSGKLLDYLHRHLHLETVVRGIVDAGLSTSVGWVEMGWDDKAANGLGEVLYRLHDTFDVYIPRGAYLYAGKLVAHHLCKAPQRTLDEIYGDERYDKKARMQVKPDSDLSASPMKARIIRKESGWLETDKVKRATVKQFYLWDDEKNSKGGNLTLFTYAGGEALREDELKDREYPLYLFQVNQDPLKVYHRAWMTDGIGINKALDRAVSQKLMYVNKALVYRILLEKQSGVTVTPFGNEQGEMIQVAPNRKFEQMKMSGLPTTMDSMTDDLNLYLEDMLAAHEASIGRMPRGARSGRTLEALQAAESNNLAGIRQSLESFLSITGKRALEIIADKYVASRVIKVSEPEIGPDGRPMNFLKVIGKGGKSKPKGATIVTGDDEVIVNIGSKLGHTLEARRETIERLAALRVIPTDEVLRQYEFPNIEEMSKRAREERLEEHTLKAEIAGRRGTTGEGGAGAVAGEGVDMRALADQENMAMMNGQDLPPTEGATLEHSQAHGDFTQSDVFAVAPPDRQQAIVAHYQGELMNQGLI